MLCTTHLLPSTPPFSSIRSTVSIELGLVTDRTDTDSVRLSGSIEHKQFNDRVPPETAGAGAFPAEVFVRFEG